MSLMGTGLDVAIDDEAFRAFAARRGGSARLDDPNDLFLRPVLELVSARLARYPLPQRDGRSRARISLGVVDAREPTAVAALRADRHVIGIYSGLLLSIIESATSLQDIFKLFSASVAKTGDVAGEVVLARPLGLNAYLSILSTGKFDPAIFGVRKNPDDPATSRALYYASCAIQFACLHEFGHIVSGHLGWLAEHGAETQLLEFIDTVPEEPVSDVSETLRFFEHEADVFALEVMINSLVNGQDAGAVEGVRPEDRLVLACLSFLILVFTWVAREGELGKPSTMHHPLGMDRLYALPMALMGVLERAPQADRLVAIALQRTRVVAHALAKRYPRFVPLLNVFEPSAVERASEIVLWMRTMDEQCASRDQWRL